MNDGIQEKNILRERFPFRLIVNNINDFTWPMHWHNAWEILYIVNSGFEITYNNHSYDLDETDIVFIPSGKLHGFNSHTATGNRIFINFDFSKLKDYFALDEIDISTHDIMIITKKDKEFHNEAENYILQMISEYERKDVIYQVAMMAKILEIMVLFSRRVTDKVKSETVEKLKNMAGIEKINKAFRFIDENYTNELMLADVAKAAGFSEYHFSRIFKKISDKNFREYLIEFRLKKAEQLLMNMENSVSDAAYAAGFNSLSTFERIFKRLNGCTPKEYRKLGTNN